MLKVYLTLQGFGVGAAAVGTTISVYAIARLMMNVPAGILGDSYGRKPLLVWGPAITALGTAPPPIHAIVMSHACHVDRY